MNERKLVESAVRSTADLFGFRSVRNRNFYISKPEISGIVNIQKFQYGPTFYLNAGVWLNALAGDVPTTHNRYHVQWRVCSLAAAQTTSWLRAALDFSAAMPQSDRTAAIHEGVAKYGFGLIAELEDEESVQEFVARTPGLFVFKEVRERGGTSPGQSSSEYSTRSASHREQ